MRKIAAVFAMATVLASGAMAGSYRDITSVQAKGSIDKGGIFLLDVRTPQEYQQGHLKGAVLIPINEVENRLREIPRDKPIIIYCAVGSRSSAMAAFLAGKGYRSVSNMQDGIVGWYRNRLPILH